LRSGEFSASVRGNGERRYSTGGDRPPPATGRRIRRTRTAFRRARSRAETVLL